MKKVLFIHHGGIAGGAPLSMLYTMQGIRENGYSIVVGLVNPLKELHEFYNSHGFETYEMPWIPLLVTISGNEGKRYNPIVWRNIYLAMIKWKKAKGFLLSFIREKDIDLVHLNSVVLSNPASLLIEENIPFIWHVREFAPRHKGFRYKFIQTKLFKAKSIIFLSNAEQNSWIGKNGHGTIVHNFINFDLFNSSLKTNKVYDTFNIKPKQKILLYVGGIHEHKGIIELINALSLVRKHFPDFLCLMPGSILPKMDLTRLEKRIKRSIYSLGLDKNCVLLPFKPNIVDLFYICDVLIFPATKPHFARPIIEAGAMKKPVIASALKAIDELVIHNESGYLVKVGDEKALAEKIIYLFENPEVCLEFGEVGFKLAHNKFEYKKQIEKIAKLYRKTLLISDR